MSLDREDYSTTQQVHRIVISGNGDNFFVGLTPQGVYSNNPQTMNDLKQNIRQVIGKIESQLCQNVIDNSQRGHLENVFVKTYLVCLYFLIK